jgi:hypothetical protein
MKPEDKSKAEAPYNINLDEIPLEEPQEGVFSSYANVANMDWTLYDVRIRFGELIQVPNEESPNWKNQHGVVLERAAISVPWHVAKHLRDLLTGVIKNYEQINGELVRIKLPASPTAD